MSYDTDPKDEQQRFLLYHPESDRLFEVDSYNLFERYVDEDGCINVTNEEKAESRFKEENEG